MNDREMVGVVSEVENIQILTATFNGDTTGVFEEQSSKTHDRMVNDRRLKQTK